MWCVEPGRYGPDMRSFRLQALPRTARLRIGLLGGSFNPAHEGHLAISQAALKRLGLDAVVWLVSPQNPLKRSAAEDQRTRLTRALDFLRNENRIHASGIEAELRTRYTLDTLRALKRRWPNVRFVWLMGSDNLAQFPRWKRWREIARSMPMAVLERPPAPARTLAGQAAQWMHTRRLPIAAARTLAIKSAPSWVWLPIRHHPESSTHLRNLLGKQ